jgi:hypothetical protein
MAPEDHDSLETWKLRAAAAEKEVERLRQRLRVLEQRGERSSGAQGGGGALFGRLADMQADLDQRRRRIRRAAVMGVLFALAVLALVVLLIVAR